MPLGVRGLLNLSSSAVIAVIVLFWLGIAAHVRKGAGLKFDRHYLASLVDRVRTVVGDGRCDNRLSFFRGCLRAIIGCDFWYLRARLEEGEMAVT